MQRRGCTVLDASYMSCAIKRGKGNAKTGTEVSDKGGAELGRNPRREDEGGQKSRGRLLGEVSLAAIGRSCVRRSLGYSISPTYPRILSRLAARNKQRHRPPLPMRHSHTSRVHGAKFYLILSPAERRIRPRQKLIDDTGGVYISRRGPIRKLSGH